MVSQLLDQFLSVTHWGSLDYLVLDMPPGTGDIQIALCDMVPEAQAVIVTTPQDIALLDCKKGIELFVQKKIKILGIVENMSGHVCSHCGTVDHIFGEDGASKLSEKYSIPLLGEIPIETALRVNADLGLPIAFTDGKISDIYMQIAERIKQ
jgi:ATP-binding protein involved in chromosome partitioning